MSKIIEEYLRLTNKIKGEGKKSKPQDEDYVIFKPRVPLVRLVDGKITEINLSQSSIKQIFWTGPPTSYVGSWELRPDACAFRTLMVDILRKFRIPQTRPMMFGNFFESLAIGSGVYSKTLGIPKNQRTGADLVDEERIRDAVDRFNKLIVESGMLVNERNTQVEFKTPIIDSDYPDIKVHFKGIGDLISPFKYKNLEYDIAVIDIKLTKNLTLTFQNPYKPWGSFPWSAPEKMTHLQGITYSEGFNLPFIYLIFSYNGKEPYFTAIPVKSVVSHPQDNEARLKSKETKQGIKSVIGLLHHWNEEEWPKNKGPHCKKCPVSSCPMKEELDFI
jgi:hypothetical protein